MINRFMLLLLVSFTAMVPTSQADTTRPNIIFILTDDQRWDALGSAGNPIIETPALDTLSAEGSTFSNAFVTTPICAASRASIMTGTLERTHGFTFGTPPLRREFADIAYPKLLRDAGYRTGFIGKFGMTYADDSEKEHFDFYDRPSRGFYGIAYYRLTSDHTGHQHVTEVIGDRSLAFIDEAVEDPRPFCLSISFNAPHAEDLDPNQYIYPQGLASLYEDVTIPPAPLSDIRFFEAQPEWVRTGLNRVRWHWRFDDAQKYQRMVKGYYRMISGVDRQVGRIRDQLHEMGLADNTIIIFTSDNGYFLNERQFAGKWLMYENSIRVPLVIYDPRASAPLVLPHLSLNIDIAPTILTYAGIAVPTAMQGLPLQTVMRDPDQGLRKSFLCEHLFDHPRIPRSEGVRTERYKYFRYLDHPEHEELYDLTADPHEKHNLATDPGHADVLKELRELCDAKIAAAVRT